METYLLQRNTRSLQGVLASNGKAIICADFDILGAHAKDLDTFLFYLHHTSTRVAAEVGLFLKPLQEANQVFGWMEGGLSSENSSVTLVDLTVPAFHSETLLICNIHAKAPGLLNLLFDFFDLLGMLGMTNRILGDFISRQISVLAFNPKLL